MTPRCFYSSGTCNTFCYCYVYGLLFCVYERLFFNNLFIKIYRTDGEKNCLNVSAKAFTSRSLNGVQCWYLAGSEELN